MIAPLLSYLAGGLPGLAMYRFCNTADAMWGYRTARYEYLGKIAARVDDMVNLAPARLTAALLASSAQLMNGRGTAAWRVALCDHGRTASPNAGWPMAAIAGALDTRLSKRGHYTIGDGERVADAALLSEARQIGRMVVGLISLGLALGAVVDGRANGASHE